MPAPTRHPSINAICSMRKTLPLNRLVLNYALGYLLLVLATGLLGGAGLLAWQRASSESLRINQLIEELQAMRGALYREMKELLDLTLLSDGEAPKQLREQERVARGHLTTLRSITSVNEAAAINKLTDAYATTQEVTDTIVRDWDRSSASMRREWLESRLESDALMNYELAFDEIEQLLTVERSALLARQKWLMHLSPVILLLPLAAALGLLLWSRHRLRRDFVEPISTIQHATEMISRGQLDHRAPERGAEELTRLSRSINLMAAELSVSRDFQLRAEKHATLAMLVPLMAHNIRNPLASIRATAQVMAEPTLPTDVLTGLAGIISTVDRLEAWTHTLLSYLHPLLPRRTQCNPADILSAVVTMLHVKLSTKGLRILISTDNAPASICLDTQLVEQALQGIVANAIDASPAAGEVSVQLDGNACELVISVTDSGPGMPFVPAMRDLAPGPSTKQFGTGLGIPFAMKVCEVHGGHLVFASRPPHGTRAELHFPLQHEQAA